MRRFLSTALAGMVACASLFASDPSASEKQTWFPKDQLMTIGVYYYPEAWPESQWERDFQNIRKLNMEFVHMGEFAWYFEEPTEGHYNFSWLDHAIDLAAKNGLKVVLCTPSATPPIWLTKNHPEVLMVNADGRTVQHGSREQGDWSSPVYREYVSKIDAELAKRYGRDKRIWGWQIDNELSHYGQYSYSKAATEAFRRWLQKKYNTIDKLNQAWGGAFWSTMYQNFDQIEIPNDKVLIAQPTPHGQLDFDRFFADEVADYIAMQASVLRKYSENQWITTNFMAMNSQVDPTRSTHTLDVFSWTHYPVHGDLNAEDGPLGFRLGNPEVMGFTHDFMRPIDGLSGPMELQPGQVNWGTVNTWPLPGAIHMWLMEAVGDGARMVCTYRYRQPIYGGELYHKGLAETDGVTPSPGGLEYQQAMRDVMELRKRYDPNAKEPESLTKRRTAFLISYDNWWDIENHTQTIRWNTVGHWMRYYRALKSMMAPVDVITPDRDFSSYPFVVAPAYQLVDQQLVDRWTNYVRNGGHLILTARTGQKDMDGHLWEGPWAAPILGLIGSKIPRYDLLPETVTGHVSFNTKQYAWGSWADILQSSDAKVLATYTDQFYAGKASVITRHLGKGTVTYVGTESLKGDLEHDVLERIYSEAGAAPANIAPGFHVNWRDGFWVATNFTSTTQRIPSAATPIMGSRDVPPGGVAVWIGK